MSDLVNNTFVRNGLLLLIKLIIGIVGFVRKKFAITEPLKVKEIMLCFDERFGDVINGDEKDVTSIFLDVISVFEIFVK